MSNISYNCRNLYYWLGNLAIALDLPEQREFDQIRKQQEVEQVILSALNPEKVYSATSKGISLINGLIKFQVTEI